MAGILAFKNPNMNGAGAKLILFCFDDKTYEQIEDKLLNATPEEQNKIYKELTITANHCRFLKLDVDALFTIDRE